MGVSVLPGHTALIRTPVRAFSTAAVFVSPRISLMACFAASSEFLGSRWWGVGLRPSITKIPRKYDNAVVVEFEADIENRLDIFNELIGSYNEMLANLYNEAISVSFYRIDFAFDPLEVKLSVNTRFTIERRLGSPFSSSRYYCIAPLKTEMHIELLEKFETALS